MAFRVTSAVQDDRQIRPRSKPLKMTRDEILPVLRIRETTQPIRVRRATSRNLPLEGPWSNEVELMRGRIKRKVSQHETKISYRIRGYAA